MRSSFSLLAAVLVFAASGAHAQCSFDAPAKAKGFKSDMVRAYSACPGVTFAAPNTVTMAGVPGCGLPVATSVYGFGVEGSCKLQMSHKAERPCAGGCPFDCANMTFKAYCKGVLDGAGLPIEEGAWSLNTVMRATMDDPVTGDMTVIDVPMQFPFGTPKRGRVKLRRSTNESFIFEICFAPFPLCSHVELINVAIVDPAGNVFATMGSSTR